MLRQAAAAALLWTWALPLPSWTVLAMRADAIAQLRQETVDMFYHGYSNYMQHAFPEDELRPLTCAPLTRDRENPGHIGLNDALGNYSLTLVDSLSTLAILASAPPEDGVHTGARALSDFQDGVAELVLHYGDGRPGPSGTGLRAVGFDLDSKVQVFETVIRGVGGLLSAHLFAIGELPIAGYHPEPATTGTESDDPLELPPIYWPNGFRYDGQLLRLALDLSERLLPAFYTDTGIPYPRVNLRHGIPFYLNSPLHRRNQAAGGSREPDAEPESRREITETCSAGAGSLTLEFTVLSRLTGDARFEQAAKRAFWEVWRRRSEIGLIGNGLDAERGTWIGPHSGIGAGMDSFFEYALKSHILLSGNDMPNASASARHDTTRRLDPNALHAPLEPELHSSDAFLEAWHQAHASVKRYLYTDRSHYPYYSNGHRATGQPYTMWIDSLGAFYPGLLALAGELDEAIEANLVYTALWTRYSALPERWSIRDNNVEAGIGWWPGRPEFIESTYHIYRATQDPWYLHVGEMVLRDIQRRCHAPCGWAGLQDVRSGDKQDRMESFFLGETTKYMYLLFDADHPLNKLDAAYVFTTEGHPLVIPKKRPGSSPHKAAKETTASSYSYYDETFTNSCPVAPAAGSLAGSATAGRPDLFGVSRFTDLYNTPNMRGEVEGIQVEDERTGRRSMRFVAKSNHTIFPWTLPPTMLPGNGTCAAPRERVMSWIEFPASDAASSLASRFGTSLMWYDHTGPTVKNLEGLRLQMEKKHLPQQPQPQQQPGGGEGPGDTVWRITHVGNTQLGRHEVVYFHAEHVKHLKDEAFTCLRRQDAVEIVLLAPTEQQQQQKNASVPLPGEQAGLPKRPATRGGSGGSEPETDLDPSESLLKSFLRVVSSVFEPTNTDVPASSADDRDSPAIYSWYANTAAGPGAFPLPSVPDTPIVGSPTYNAKNPGADFPWSTVYLAGHACDGPLPDAAPRDHQVIVMLRGGCSFSEKLDNIPGFPVRRGALQLVVVLDVVPDEDDDDDYDLDGEEGGPQGKGGATREETPRPLLDREQRTPKGLKRLHGVPMVLMRAGRGEHDLFRGASGVGMRRKYLVHSQGLLVENAVVI